MRFAVLIIGTFLLAGPATAQVGAPSTDNLIIFRAHAEPIAWSPTIKVDGIKIVALPNRHYTSVRVGPGMHQITMSWPFISRQSGGKLDIDVRGGEVHYIEVTGTSFYSGRAMRMGSQLAELNPDDAQRTIQSCCALKPSK